MSEHADMIDVALPPSHHSTSAVRFSTMTVNLTQTRSLDRRKKKRRSKWMTSPRTAAVVARASNPVGGNHGQDARANCLNDSVAVSGNSLEGFQLPEFAADAATEESAHDDASDESVPALSSDAGQNVHDDKLMQIVNVEPADMPLLIGWLTAALRPAGPHPILVINGEQGSAKSTLRPYLPALGRSAQPPPPR